MNFFCSKCGHYGENVAPHLAPKGSGRTCNYSPIELEPISEEGAQEILRQYGWDFHESSERKVDQS